MADILVVGLSARALSQSARAAGYRPFAADMFGDLDLRESAAASARIDGDLDAGLRWEPTIAALSTAAADAEPIGIICGTGFEDRPALLDGLAARWTLLGNGSEAVRRVKEPASLAELCRVLGIPHPRVSETPRRSWIEKRKGGAGGAHVAPHSRPSRCHPRASEARPEYPGPLGTRVEPECDKPLEPGYPRLPENRTECPATGEIYWQERVAGEPISALVLGSGDDALVLGFSAQWADPLPDAPYRYGGAVRPADLPSPVEAALESAARAIVTSARLVGLNSVDFLVAPDAWRLIEVNPRPGAMLDIFDSEETRLVALHVEACHGRLPVRMPAPAKAAAAAIVYARRNVKHVAEIAWPDWTADRQAPGTAVADGAPVCTVVGHAATAAAARRLVAERGAAIRAALGVD